MRITQCKQDWALHALMTFKYAHLMEKARVIVAWNGINDARQWDHMRGRPACCSNKSPGARCRISKCKITSRTHGHSLVRTVRPELGYPHEWILKPYLRHMIPMSGYESLYDPYEDRWPTDRRDVLHYSDAWGENPFWTMFWMHDVTNFNPSEMEYGYWVRIIT